MWNFRVGRCLQKRGNRSRLFLTTGISSVIVTTAEGKRAEAGIFGFDGYIPTSAIAGVEDSSYGVLVRVAAQGYELPYEKVSAVDGRKPQFFQDHDPLYRGVFRSACLYRRLECHS